MERRGGEDVCVRITWSEVCSSRDSEEGRAALAYVVSLDEITSKDLAGSNSTVVRTLGSGEPTLGPTVRSTIRVEESVLLLESEPGFVLVPHGVDKLSASSAAVDGPNPPRLTSLAKFMFFSQKCLWLLVAGVPSGK